MRHQRAFWITPLVALIATVAFAADPGDTKLGKCLPTDNEVSGWSVTGGTYKYGEGNGIADIYNGGFEKLVQQGMKAACVQSYANGSRNANVYCNEFGSGDQAKNYFNSETGNGSGWSSLSAGDGARYKKTSSVVVGHLYKGKVHAKVVAKGTGDEQVEAVKAFLQKLATRIGQNY